MRTGDERAHVHEIQGRDDDGEFQSRRHSADGKAAWNGRWFDGRQIAASMWDGKTKISTGQDESDAAQRARLDAYAKSLGARTTDEDDEDEDDEDEDEDANA